jgi:hypothetical protein
MSMCSTTPQRCSPGARRQCITTEPLGGMRHRSWQYGMVQSHCFTAGLQKALQHGWMSWLLPSTRGESQQQVLSGMQLRLQYHQACTQQKQHRCGSRFSTSSTGAVFIACCVSCVCWTSTAGVYDVLQQYAGGPTSQLQLRALPRLCSMDGQANTSALAHQSRQQLEHL